MSRQGRKSANPTIFFSNQLPLVSTGFKHMTRVQNTSQESLRGETDNERATLDEDSTSVLYHMASRAVRLIGDRVPPSRRLRALGRDPALKSADVLEVTCSPGLTLFLKAEGWALRREARCLSQRPLGAVVRRGRRFDWLSALRTPIPAGPRGLGRCLFLLWRLEAWLHQVQRIW